MRFSSVLALFTVGVFAAPTEVAEGSVSPAVTSASPQSRGVDLLGLVGINHSTNTDDFPKVKELVEKLSDAYSSLDANRMADLFADDGIYDDYLLGKTGLHKEEIRAYFSVLIGIYTDFKITTKNVFGTLDLAGWEIDLTFVSGVDVPEVGIKKGDHVTIHGVSLLSWENEEITSLREYLVIDREQ